MIDELKPCPFCGDEPALSKSQAPFRAEYMVICARGCGACNGWKDTAEEAIEAWNTRKEPAHLPEWAKEAIEKIVMDANKRTSGGAANVSPCQRYGLVLLGKILSLRKPEEKV